MVLLQSSYVGEHIPDCLGSAHRHSCTFSCWTLCSPCLASMASSSKALHIRNYDHISWDWKTCSQAPSQLKPAPTHQDEVPFAHSLLAIYSLSTQNVRYAAPAVLRNTPGHMYTASPASLPSSPTQTANSHCQLSLPPLFGNGVSV